MRSFLLNILLALAWGALTGDFSPVNLLAGFIFAYVALWIMKYVMLSDSYFTRASKLVYLIAHFIKELVVANLRVAYHVLAPSDRMHPGIIGIPLDITSDTQITVLANMITLTPGTLSLDISSDRSVLYVHNIEVTDPEEFRKEIKAGFEHNILEVSGDS